MPHAAQRSFLTADVPPIGGVLRQRPEDFLVDELPLFDPAGEGEHIYLLVQKRELTTPEVVDVLADHFGVPPMAVGYAGLKDKLAVTRQVFSVHAPGKKPEDFPQLRHERIGVLWTDLHTSKLRLGQLAGNRFSIRIRGVSPTDVRAAKRVLDRLAVVGLPNRFGPQRFGHDGRNHLIGRGMLRGEIPVGRARDQRRTRLMLSAIQSAIFNTVLDRRVISGTLGALRSGDIAVKHANGAAFAVDETTANDPITARRLAGFEISPSGPMWAGRMLRAKNETDIEEIRALEELELRVETLEEFDRRHPKLLRGERRALRVPLGSVEVEGGVDEHGAYVRCAFDLPAGSYATSVLEEVMKNGVEQSS